MLWLLTICEGRSFDIMVRAAELALTLARRFPIQVQFEKEEAYSPWRHLLSPRQQVALRALAAPPQDPQRNVQEWVDQADTMRNATAMDADGWRAASAALQDNMVQPLWLRTGDAITPRPPPGTWLILLTRGEAAASDVLARYAKLLTFGPCSSTDDHVELPFGVDAELFTKAHAPAPRENILVIGDGDVPRDITTVQWAQSAGAQHITFFDPYHCRADYPAELFIKNTVSYCDARAPTVRRDMYARTSAAIVARAAMRVDNHFLWEAASMGVMPLAYYSHVANAADEWDAARCAAVMQAHLHHASTAPLPDIVDWHVIPERVTGAAPTLRNNAALPAPTFEMAPHRVALYRSPQQAAGNASTSPATRRIIIVSPGTNATYPDDLTVLLRGCDEVHVDTSLNAEFFVQLLAAYYEGRAQVISEVGPTLTRLMHRETPHHIDVIYVDDSPDRRLALQSLLEGLQQRWDGSGTSAARLPSVVIHINKRFEASATSSRRIGVSVATDAIIAGLQTDAPGRFLITWMGAQPSGSERGRLYFYPFDNLVGLDHDEIDYPSLPRMLQADKIDLLCSIDPFMVGGASARLLWGKRAIPVVGMLHSIHSAAGATEALLQLLSGPTFAFDTIISPSACGATAYRALFDAASAWIARFKPDAPTFQGRIEVIPYGIDASFYQGIHRPAAREALGVPHDTFLLLSLGRFNKNEKADLFPLLLAVQQLARSHPKTMLILAGASGKDKYPETLRTVCQTLGISERVLFFEDISAYDKALMYGAADVFVTISDNIQETYGLTLLEAMAAGLPTVASGWNGYREIVRHDETGLLVPTYTSAIPEALEYVQRIAEGLFGYGHRDLCESVAVDPFALVQALDRLAANPEMRLRMGEAGRRVCQSDYDQIKQARKTGDLFLELLAMAKDTPWPPVSPYAPYHDPVSRRFAHYPSDGRLADDTRVALSPWAQDAEWLRQVRSHLEVRTRAEAALLSRLLEIIGREGPLTITVLANRLQTPQYPSEHIKPRIVRCLKYGLLIRVLA